MSLREGVVPWAVPVVLEDPAGPFASLPWWRQGQQEPLAKNPTTCWNSPPPLPPWLSDVIQNSPSRKLPFPLGEAEGPCEKTVEVPCQVAAWGYSCSAWINSQMDKRCLSQC